jgi:hypothetical protein
MPKGIDPKAYAARVTKAKKIVESMDPATKTKIKDMYPKVTKESIVNKALNPKKAVVKKAAAKPTTKPAVKKASNGSNTKPFNVRLIKPDEIIKDKPKGPKVVGRTPKPKAPVKKAPMKPKAKPTKKYRDATDIPGFMFGRGTE